MSRLSTVLCVVCSVLLLNPPGLYGQSSSPQKLRDQIRKLHRELDEFQDRLQETRTKRKRTRQQLRETERREESLLGVIQRYNNQIQQARERLRRLKKLEQQARERLREVNDRLERTRNRLRDHKQDLAGRLRQLYMQGQVRRTQLLVRAESVTDLMTRMRYYREILAQDRRVLEQYRSTREELESLLQQRKETLKRRRQLRQKVARVVSRKSKLVARRKQVLETIRERQSLYNRRLQELKNQRKKLRRTVLELQQRRSQKRRRLERLRAEFGQRKGSLPWPVDSRELLRPFGSRERDDLENDGIDIRVEHGTPVRAVAPGKVMFARPYTGMGTVVILRHGGGYLSLYGSLVETRVEEGEKVEEGQRLGRAGQTAGLEKARLYFQLFQGKNVLNPTRWLK